MTVLFHVWIAYQFVQLFIHRREIRHAIRAGTQDFYPLFVNKLTRDISFSDDPKRLFIYII